jgi:hypothetical protein
MPDDIHDPLNTTALPPPVEDVIIVNGRRYEAVEAGVISIANRRYLTPEALARVLGVTTRTLLRWAQQRTGPPRIKIGNQPLYDEEKLPGWLAQHEQQPVRSQRRRRSGGTDARPTA